MNNRGFSLIEVMVALAVLSIMVCGSMQQMSMMMIQNQTSNVTSNVTAIAGSMSLVTLNETACTAAVTKTSQKLGPELSMTMPDGRVVAKGQTLSGFNLKVDALSYKNQVLFQTNPDGTKTYYGNLDLYVSSVIPVLGTKAYPPKTLGLVYLTVDAGNTVVKCGVVAPASPAPTVPPVPLVADPVDTSTKAGCSYIGGTMSNGVCVVHSGKA